MAAQQCVLDSSRQDRFEFWQRFRKELAHRVLDCNITADEHLWVINCSGDTGNCIAVESAHRRGERAECSFDPEGGILARVGSSEPLLFRWGVGTLLVRGRQECALGEVLTAILDELVRNEDE